ncbi:putative alpha/Beta hydrolase [Helianthus annuus]|nr:putative alpha/Beta hydrolase [Helianthus annuus]
MGPWAQLLDNLPLPNIKWICPTAPTRPVTVLGGFPCTACKKISRLKHNIRLSKLSEWSLRFDHFCHFSSKLKPFEFESGSLWFQLCCHFHQKAKSGFDEGELSDDGPKDVEGLDTSASHIANLLSTEPSDGKFFFTFFCFNDINLIYFEHPF